ncbi:MAG: hypothetical protein DDT20_00771 [Firmicutes bacterium]|nr:hypothetical protein [Bacillota bacterium]
MNILDRIMLTLYTLAVAALSLLVFGASIDFPPGFYSAELGALLTQWEAILVALFFFVVSVRFLLSGIRRERPSRAAVTHQGELGDVRISLNAIRNLTQRTVLGLRGVHTAKVRVQLAEKGLELTIELAVTQDSNIPALTAQVQETVRKHIEACTGVGVLAVRVLVVEMAPASSRVRVQ